MGRGVCLAVSSRPLGQWQRRPDGRTCSGDCWVTGVVTGNVSDPRHGLFWCPCLWRRPVAPWILSRPANRTGTCILWSFLAVHMPTLTWHRQIYWRWHAHLSQVNMAPANAGRWRLGKYGGENKNRDRYTSKKLCRRIPKGLGKRSPSETKTNSPIL